MRLPLGASAPDFNLPDYAPGANGRKVSRADTARGKPLIVMFICNHCPFVKHIRSQLAQLAKDYAGKAAFVAINPNDVENYPDDAPPLMTAEAQEAGYTFPYLYDEMQSAAKAYSAACTPDFFLFDAGNKLIYRGQLDASRPGNGIAVTGNDLRGALDAAVANRPVAARQLPSIGCNIKWKTGNEPDYFQS